MLRGQARRDGITLSSLRPLDEARRGAVSYRLERQMVTTVVSCMERKKRPHGSLFLQPTHPRHRPQLTSMTVNELNPESTRPSYETLHPRAANKEEGDFRYISSIQSPTCSSPDAKRPVLGINANPHIVCVYKTRDDNLFTEGRSLNTPFFRPPD